MAERRCSPRLPGIRPALPRARRRSAACIPAALPAHTNWPPLQDRFLGWECAGAGGVIHFYTTSLDYDDGEPAAVDIALMLACPTHACEAPPLACGAGHGRHGGGLLVAVGRAPAGCKPTSWLGILALDRPTPTEAFNSALLRSRHVCSGARAVPGWPAGGQRAQIQLHTGPRRLPQGRRPLDRAPRAHHAAAGRRRGRGRRRVPVRSARQASSRGGLILECL